MPRVNVTTWSDNVVLTRLIGQLQEEQMKYQMHAAPREDGKWGVGAFSGDQGLMIAAIMLRDRLDDLITRSREANS